MRQQTAIIIAFSLFTLLLSPSFSLAEEGRKLMVEGILKNIKNIPGENRQLKLGEGWYSIEDNSDLFMCDQKMEEKTLDDLAEFIDYRLSLTPSSAKTYNKIHVMCE